MLLRIRHLLRRLIGVCFALVCLVPLAGMAQEDGRQAPFLMRADRVVVEQDGALIRAEGNVEISQQGRVLRADAIIYQRDSGRVTAEGNVYLFKESGEVLSADRVVLDSNLESGFIENLRVMLVDRSRFAANGARRSGGQRTEMSKAVYSPCQLCAKDPTRAPLWQVKARRIIHDQKEKKIQYLDASLEFYGIPIAYLPYFEHPDPSVDRASGFLAPSFGSNSELGAKVQVSYFYNIAPDQDFTFKPILTSKEGVVLAGEYRRLSENGRYLLDASATYVDERNSANQKTGSMDFRGHIRGDGRFSYDQDWRWGWDLSRASDDTYLQRYDLGNDDTLTSDIFARRIKKRDYANVSAYAFQGLKVEDDSSTTPLVAPLFDYITNTDPFILGRGFELEVSGVSLYRTGGQDVKRLTLGANWSYPYVSPLGDIYEFSLSARNDLYFLNDVENPSDPSEPTRNDVESRFTPTAALSWRMPFVRSAGASSQTIEPIVQFVVSPSQGAEADIPNEDSLSFEFDDTNLFSLNRFPGYDRVEGGARVNYGLRVSHYGEDGQFASATVGQVYRPSDDANFADRTGLDEEFSDYVAALTITPFRNYELTGRFRIDRNDLSLRRNEIYASVGPEYLRLDASYIRLREELTTTEFEDREEIYGSLRANIFDKWRLHLYGRRDLSDGGNTIHTGVGVGFKDECLSFTISLDKDNTSDRDAPSSTSINFRIVLRNLG